ncbi:FecR domain-containing protein [uncultured Parabacteroides sp.]|uniref:FecR family protein n=1 Tax=uncultured Parabacteroides sp. TaxID=512312 RepID=UPI0025E85248|nr:FecR domain-containing protein [uncultured Parabacteroides sp.]
MDKKQNISDKQSFEQAGRDLLQKVREAEKKELREALNSWQEIELHLEKTHSSTRFYIRRILSVAASLAVLLSIGIYYWMETEENSSMSLALLDTANSSLSGDEIVLIENKDKMQLKDESSIRYDAQGKSNVEEHVVKKETAVEREEKKEEVNQIIVPKGRRANITFSDGTKMFVNAGTRVIYPAVFKKDKREILVEGEVYLEVEKDPSRPFIVKTNGFDVKVLGTEFNVCAYKEDVSAFVVLVNGSVEVRMGRNEKSQLSPNQRIEINEKGSNISEVDVFEYICWKDNMMLLNDRKVGETLDRLSRYYGRGIWYNEEIGNIPVSGKLDLRENMEDVISILCQSLFLQYKTDANNNIIISK